MRILGTILVFTTALCSARAQTSTLSNTPVAGPKAIYMTTRTNLLSVSNAVKIASGLRVGMAKADLDKYLMEHGISQTNIFSVSLDRGRTLSCPYPLAGAETSLMLELECSQPPTSGLHGWKNPLLKRAYIQSWGTNVIPITLTNAP